MEKIKVLLADDQMLLAESLKMVLETRADDIVVVGVAANGKEALQLAETEQPDVVLMDVRMPELDGVESARLLKAKFPQIKVLMLTTFEDDEYIVKALHLGAVGYLLKDMPPEELIQSLRTVYQGGAPLAQRVVTKLANRLFQIDYQNPARSRDKADTPEWLKSLNNRERDILRLLAKGYDNREIAAHIYLAEQTVKNYVSVIYCKMGVRDRIQALRLAEDTGFV